MSPVASFGIVVLIAALIALPFGLVLKRKGYKFWYSTVAAFIASIGVLGLLYSMLRDYF